MKKLAIALLIVVAMASTAFAQAEKYDAGVFFDTQGMTSSAAVGAFTPFNFYALAFDLDGQVKGYEFGAVIDPRITVTASVMNPTTGLNLGAAPSNWIVGTGACLLDTPGEWFLMVSWTGLLFAPDQDITICLTASNPSSFVPAVPGYLQCDGSLVPFGVAQNGGGFYPDGCGVLNPTFPEPIGTVDSSWGAVKANF